MLGFEQGKHGGKAAAQRHSQRRIEAFRLGFRKLMAVIGKDSEIGVGIKRDGK
ncbi:hypothetical protein [Enterobacter kobei]|uniref:hypothetical protein n=1 Tax=Enterobacter kobei TaxID=208224 RepID=UPI003709696F